VTAHDDDAIPRDLAAALGLDADTLGPSGSPPPTGLDDEIRARIARSLDEGQGAWRARSPVKRAAPFVVAVVVAVGYFVALPPAPNASALHVVASLVAALAGLLAIVAVAVAPQSPGRGERLAQLAIVVGVVAVVVEVALALSLPASGDVGVVCFAFTLIGAVLPIAVVAGALRSSGLPLRPSHAVAAATAGFALAAGTVWLHCPSEALVHLLVGHATLPALVVVGLGLAFAAKLARRGSVAD